jgi:type IV secretory pathway VirB10-like protein
VPSGLGLRVALLAAALVAVAVVAVVANWSTWTIVAVMAVAFLIVSAIEITASRREAAKTDDVPAAEAGEEPPKHVHVLDDEPQIEPEPEPEQVPERGPPPPEPERPPLVAAPPPPEPARIEPEPAPVALPVAIRHGTPREWNLWELEQASRRASGDDPLRDEERNYLLMYLREFANAEGTLPSDFDALVRDSFADVIPAG